jgi:hypothetical protein
MLLNDSDFDFKILHKFNASPSTFAHRKQAVLSFEKDFTVTDPDMYKFVHKSFIEPYLKRFGVSHNRNQRKHQLWIKLLQNLPEGAPSKLPKPANARGRRKNAYRSTSVGVNSNGSSFSIAESRRRPRSASRTSASSVNSRVSVLRRSLPKPTARPVCQPLLTTYQKLLDTFLIEDAKHFDGETKTSLVPLEEVEKKALKLFRANAENIVAQLATQLRNSIQSVRQSKTHNPQDDDGDETDSQPLKKDLKEDLQDDDEEDDDEEDFDPREGHQNDDDEWLKDSFKEAFERIKKLHRSDDKRLFTKVVAETAQRFVDNEYDDIFNIVSSHIDEFKNVFAHDSLVKAFSKALTELMANASKISDVTYLFSKWNIDTNTQKLYLLNEMLEESTQDAKMQKRLKKLIDHYSNN